jgi:hypothetical protein
MKHALAILLFVFCLPAGAEWSRRDFRLSVMPFGGAHFGVSNLESSATNITGGSGLSFGPQLGVRLKAERGPFFVAPDVSIGPLFGVGGTPLVWSIGFIAGPHLGFSGFDVYAGLSHKDFVSFDGSGGTFYRAGAVFSPQGKAYQVFVEGVYGALTRYTPGYQAECTYYGLEGGVQIPLDFGQASK